MYAAPFDYFRANSVAEAQKLLAGHPGSKLLAGGHSLIPLLKLRLSAPSALIDIGRIKDLKGISSSGDSLRIGALTTHSEIGGNETLASACPILPEAAEMIGDLQVRNAGTIGGNIAHADPASDLPTVLMALEAKMHAMGPRGQRSIPASEFFEGMMTTSLAPDDILTSIEVPSRQAGQGMAYVKFGHPASRYAVIGVAAILTVKDGTCTDARVAIGGLLPVAARCTAVELALKGQRVSATDISRVAGGVKGVLSDVLGDIYASAEYRSAMAPVYVQRALTSALARAR
jgi:aerobic carbon-monoxide dehydrogenase medium subunit